MTVSGGDTVAGYAAQRSANVALLIDADNASAASLDATLTVLAELGSVNIRRAYGNWRKDSLKGWNDAALRYAIDQRQQTDVTRGKNATDMAMTIDAMDLLHAGRIDGFGIMSSDSDFMPLARRIRQDGLPVYGFGAGRTPEGFRAACTRFIDVEVLVAAEADAASPEFAVVPPPGNDPALIKLIGDAIKASKRDERGFARLSEVGQLAGNRSSFDARNYGAARLSDLIETLPEFATERRAEGMFVRRMR